MSCPLCGDPSVSRDRAAIDDPLLLMAAEASREEYMEHLRTVHPGEWEREKAQQDAMSAALASVFGKGRS